MECQTCCFHYLWIIIVHHLLCCLYIENWLKNGKLNTSDLKTGLYNFGQLCVSPCYGCLLVNRSGVSNIVFWLFIIIVHDLLCCLHWWCLINRYGVSNMLFSLFMDHYCASLVVFSILRMGWKMENSTSQISRLDYIILDSFALVLAMGA